MDQHVYSITFEELKQLYPNFEILGGELSDDNQASQQQVILAPNDSYILNDAPLQQLVAYQQTSQNAQTYVIQSSENDSSQQTAAVAQSSIYYAEVPSGQSIQHQPVQQQQQQHLNLAHQVRQDTAQQSLILQDTMGTNQQTTSPLIQQTIPTQSTTHQHVIVQQTPHIVLQQQAATQHQHQSTNQLVIRPLTVNQPRYIYQQNQTTRTLIYNTQPQATLSTNNQSQSMEQQNIQQQTIQQQSIQQHNVQSQQQQKPHVQTQQVESAQSHTGVMQQQTRHLIVSGQHHMQSNLIYQSPQSQSQHQQQRLHQQFQNTQSALLHKRQVDSSSTPMSPSRVIRTASPRAPIIAQSQTPKLTPFRTNPRFQSPPPLSNQITSASVVTTTIDNVSPPSATTTSKQMPRKSPNARGRGSATGRGGRGGAPLRPQSQSSLSLIQQQQAQQQTAQQQQQQLQETQQRQSQIRSVQTQQNVPSNANQTPPLARSLVPPLVSTPNVQQRIFNSVLNCSGGTSKAIPTPGHVAHRVITTQTPSKLNSPSGGQSAAQLTQTYRIPKQNTTNISTNVNDLEESIQAVVVTKANERSTSTSTDSAAPKAFQTTVTTYSTIEFPNDEKKTLKINGRVLPLSELKRQQQKLQQHPSQLANKSFHPSRTSTPIANRSANVSTGTQPPPSYQRSAGQQPQQNENSKKIVRAATQNQQIIQPISNNKLQNPTGDSQKSARMLVILGNGEQRLITFTLPRESCTVQELLEQVGVPFTPETSIQCFPNPGANIDYIVTVGITVQEPAKLATAAENSLQLSKQQQDTSTQHTSTTTEQATQSSTNDKSSPDTPKEPPTKIIPGFLAVCTQCGYTGCDFAKCERCKRIFTEEPRRVTTAKVLAKSEEEKKKAASAAELLSRAAAKAALTVTAGVLPQIRAGKVTLTTTLARGRGRAVARIKPAEIEPVILTLSSDDEGDDEKSNKSMKAPVVVPNLPIQRPPLTCEPIILESMPSPANMEREDIGNISTLGDQLHVALTCRVIRFGTYRYEPKEKVLFTSKGMKVVAPSCKNPLDAVVLNIQTREIVKIVAHFSKSLNILFIYTLPACGSYVRESLEMKPKSPDTPYYNPSDRAEPYKRIVLQMDVMIEEHKTVIRSIFTKDKLEEVQCSEANELLLRSCMKDKYIKQEQGSTVKTDPENIRQILIYPPGKGGMPINTEDYMCLAIDQYLNDVIIDFFLKYLHLNILTEEQRPKTHIFSSFFYNRLTTMTTRQRQSDKDLKLTASQKRHARVKSWTKNVNLFEKDFIIIPINEQSHWFLAIVCFPRLQGPVTYDTHEPVVNQPAVKKKKPTERKVSLQIGSTTITPLTKRELDSVCLADDSLSERDEAEGDDSDLASDESDSETPNGNSTATPNSEADQHRPIKQPLILIFDSLAGASRSRVVATLRDYLTCEYRAKIKEDSVHVFNKLNMPGHCVKVPQQNNFTDCGLYVLQYVEQFFKDPIKDYKLPIKQLVNWFETIVVTRKREEISNLLKELVEKYNPDRLPLPEIAFPTLNGDLVEPEATDEQAEFEEEEMEEEGEEEEEEEVDSLAAGDNEGEASPLKRNGEKRIIGIGTSGAQTPTIALKRPLESELTKIQDPVARKTARLSDTN